MSLEALQRTIRDLPATVYRAKGSVLSSQDPTRRAVLQAVGRGSSITFDGSWGGRPRQTDLVVIGTEHALESDELRAAFAACEDQPATQRA